jgi:hypothetical protein
MTTLTTSTPGDTTTIQLPRTHWTRWHTVSLFAIVAAILLPGLLLPLQHRLEVWGSSMALLALFAGIAGHGITGLWHGMLIDERNKISLSRLQMILWMIVLLSGFITATLANVAAGRPDPLAIEISSELWLLLGISTTALVGSPLVKQAKRAKSASQLDVQRARTQLAVQRGMQDDEAADRIEVDGQLMVNRSPADARWSDMFRGEEAGNAGHLSLAKIQMFYFTLILVLAYAMALGAMFAGSAIIIDRLPAPDGSILALLGISHAGYLSDKAVPHTRTE